MSFRNIFKTGNKAAKNEFEKKYKMDPKALGSGQFAEVFRATSRAKPDEEFAVKVVDKSRLTSAADKEGLELEIRILQELNFKGIIRLYDVFNTNDKVYLVMELAKGGELFERIVKKTKEGAYSEQEAAKTVKQIAEALKYCHDRKVVHRDLKPENLLLDSPDDEAAIKLADFGFAAYCENELDDGCGTLVYVAPEILRGDPYHTSPDMWSLGVITYILLCGYPPFFHTDQEILSKKIVRGRYKFRADDWDRVSEDAKNFIRGLLKRHPENRMTADDVLKHPWIVNYASLSTEQLDINDEMRKFKAKMLLQRALFVVKAYNKLQEKLKTFDADAPDAEIDEDNNEGGLDI